MKSILLWVGIVALSLQDYFKKQPIKKTRQQQFFQTGETAQVFIAGNKKVKCKCGWTWKLSDGGNDPYICHKCGYDNSTEPIEGTSQAFIEGLKTNTMIKIKKIAAGFYEGTYKGVSFTITKVDISEIAWYWQIGNNPAEDWHSSKKIAIEAVKNYIDEQ